MGQNLSKLWNIATAIAVLGFIVQPAFCEYPKHESACKSQRQEGMHWTYCISKIEGSRNPDVVYFLTGLGGNAQDWVTRSQGIYDQWTLDSHDAPTVVSISFGKFWVLAPRSSSEGAGKKMEFLVQSLMPQIENELGGLHGKRILAGASLGGFNATELYLFYPHLFNRVALLCPALTEISPFAKHREFRNYIASTNADPFKVFRSRFMAHLIFKDQEHYDAVSPFTVAPLILNSSFPELYVSIGSEDEYGFYDSVHDFVNLARMKGVATQWKPVKGGHCSFDPTSFAKFVENRSFIELL